MFGRFKKRSAGDGTPPTHRVTVSGPNAGGMAVILVEFASGDTMLASFPAEDHRWARIHGRNMAAELIRREPLETSSMKMDDEGHPTTTWKEK